MGRPLPKSYRNVSIFLMPATIFPYCVQRKGRSRIGPKHSRQAQISYACNAFVASFYAHAQTSCLLHPPSYSAMLCGLSEVVQAENSFFFQLSSRYTLGLVMLFPSYLFLFLDCIPFVLAQGFSDIQGLPRCGVSGTQHRVPDMHALKLMRTSEDV